MTDWVWLEEREALAIHGRSLVLHGGPDGVRDAGLLASVLARPKQLMANGGEVDVVSLAAAYTAGIVQNHPFIDGNKRTGFILGILFLELNGMVFEASEAAATEAVLALAAGTWTNVDYEGFLRDNCRPEQAASSSAL
ncbi:MULTISPECIES: type II toxin-antitoxin system death-on-curing family toxin [Asticcacaulis]|uniref:type II toxin-antitoxin system death-on-curing family toxin n=1 Tax=Asticcacaulis TaxID=76890 RepID=UPI001AE9316F|nr:MULTISPECIES: type II toxin-antitoxin system death-on-curing family toxin [Asticcacaulis]MBP2161327.1 death-on-curing protein [Asticcacaulis solisilvae]MDR6802307.1 death-on-curing protein [Asticcacaulis sp. BE141]